MSVTGSLQKKGNRWYGVFGIPDPKTGQKKQKWIKLDILPNAPKREAKAAFDDLKASYNVGSIIYSQNIQFAEWVNRWLEHKRGYVEETTLEAYQTYIEKRIAPYFSARKTVLQKMTVVDVQDFYDGMTRDGLSPTTVRRYHAVINGALEWAYKSRLIRENPADRVELPPLKKGNVGQALTLEETLQLLEKFREHKLYPVVMLAAVYGMRREEILGLEWANVDLEQREFHICKTVTRNRTLIVKDTAKSKSGLRTLHMLPDVYEMFRRLKVQQAEQRLAYGEKYQGDHDFVVRHENGRMMKPDYVSGTFKKLLQQYGLPEIRFHDLRHTAATLMLENKADLLDVRDTLGHATVKITADLYGQHAKREATKRTAVKMASVFKLSS